MLLISTSILWAMARTHSNRGPRTQALHIEGLERVKWSFFNIALKSLQTTRDSLGRRVTDSVPESNNSVKIRGLKCWLWDQTWVPKQSCDLMRERYRVCLTDTSVSNGQVRFRSPSSLLAFAATETTCFSHESVSLTITPRSFSSVTRSS